MMLIDLGENKISKQQSNFTFALSPLRSQPVAVILCRQGDSDKRTISWVQEWNTCKQNWWIATCWRGEDRTKLSDDTDTPSGPVTDNGPGRPEPVTTPERKHWLRADRGHPFFCPGFRPTWFLENQVNPFVGLLYFKLGLFWKIRAILKNN